MQSFISTNQHRDTFSGRVRLFRARPLTCFIGSYFDFICGYLSCCQSKMRLQGGFSLLCLAYALPCLWEQPGVE